ncbi:MAG TPA: MMPL family transporter [Solirubrobacterales bacterium]|jgi:RND superfamily putative drug exporter|nr:MMPL family transporter [Solirubrobacterales bacterium]
MSTPLDRPPASRSAALAARVARLATRRARLVVAAWFLAVFVLAGQGKELEKELVIHSPLVNGSASKLAHEIDLREFGNDYPMIVLLRGPAGAVERQGRMLARRVRATPPMIVTSPWDGGAVVEGLSPRPGVAALLVRTASSGDDSVSGLLPPLQRQVDRTIGGPVKPSIAGLPVVIDSLHESLTNSAKVGQLIALPVLLLVLMLVFRSALAALTPLLVGGSIVVATRGILSILLNFVELDLFVIGVSAMMGLALGVDYSLLVVSRFREERKHAELPEAMVATVTATARSILPAGGALLLAMFVAQLVLPGLLIRSVAIGVGIAAVLSVFSALCIVPALLTLFGRHLDRWALPPRRSGGVAPLRWSRRVIDRPGVVLALIFALVVLAAVAFNLHSGIATAGLLPSGDPARTQQEEIERALGPGWVSPTEVVIDGRGKPVTSPQRLKAIADFQRKVEADPGVASTAGLAPIERGARRLTDGFEDGLVKQEHGLDRLESGLVRLGKGAAGSTKGLAAAAAGSRALNAGVGAASDGAGALASGLEATSDGSGQLSEGLGQVDEGSGRLARGTAKASTGAGLLANGIAQAAEKTDEIQGSARIFKNAMLSGQERLEVLHAPLHDAEAQLAAALGALQRMTSGRSDPEYAAALAAVEEAGMKVTGRNPHTGEADDPNYRGLGEGIEGAEGQFEVGEYLASQMAKNGRKASKGFEKLADASAGLDHGLRRIATGSQRVSNGVAALNHGGEVLSPALRRLSSGAKRLDGGLELLDGGSGRLASGLSEGATKSRALPRALRRIGNALESGRKAGGGQSPLALLRQRSPGLFHSGYFVLAALDGSPPEQRSKIGALVSIDHGGTDARVLVIPKNETTTEAAKETTQRLEADAEGLARQTGARVLVGGVGPVAMDVNDEFRGQAGPMRLAMALISLLILIPLLRSLTIPLLATVINLLTVSASFGVLALLFNTSLLGGPGYVDVTVVPGAIMVIFGLAIDYEVFVFARIREEYLRTGSTRQAITLGLDRTAHVVTGAAVIMITVFLSFSVSGLMSLRNFGVAQAIAVFIDAFIVRLIVVPAVMLWLGDRCWWMPRWLDRLLPGESPTPARAEGDAA